MAPAFAFIELVDHHQQFVCRRLNARSQLGDGIAKYDGFGLALEARSLVGEVLRRVT